MKNTFCKEERLCNKISIDYLFTSKEKQKITEFPLIAIAVSSEDRMQKYPAKMMVSVSKRNVKSAVKRNLIKRRVREAYRLHKNEFYHKLNEQNKTILISFIFLGNKPIPFAVIEKKIIVLLTRLTEKSV